MEKQESKRDARFASILDQMIKIAERKGNVIVLSRKEFDRIMKYASE